MICPICKLDKPEVRRQNILFIGTDNIEKDMSMNMCADCRDRAKRRLWPDS